MRFSKWIVIVVILLNAIFAAAVLYVFSQVGSEPTTLIGAWFAFTTGELLALASLKRHEINNMGGGGDGDESGEDLH